MTRGPLRHGDAARTTQRGCDAGTVPEGDVVWRTARQLDRALAGRVLTRSDFRVPRFAAADLTGSAVTAAVSRGKHLLIRTDGGRTVHSHLRMDGSWRIRPAGGPPPGDHRVRLVLANEAWQAVGYLLAMVQVISSENEDLVVGHLGPDLLGPDWDSAEAVRRLRRDPARPIGEALLDQRNLAGIGNVYKCEVLFLRGISPWRPVAAAAGTAGAGSTDGAGSTAGAGSTDGLEALVSLARRLLDANKNRTGHITTGSTRRGEENWVYGRSGRPCRRCGTAIRAAGQGSPDRGTPGQRAAGGDPRERITFWCPHCQPADPGQGTG